MFNNSFSPEILTFVRQCGGRKVRARQVQMPIRLMGIECWASKATDTHTEFVILIAFQRKQRFSRRRLSVTYCLCQFINKESLLLITSCEMHTNNSVGKREGKNCLGDTGCSRLRSGNACYHSVQNLLSSRLLSKNLKFKIYITIILPVVLYGCETWSLT